MHLLVRRAPRPLPQENAGSCLAPRMLRLVRPPHGCTETLISSLRSPRDRGLRLREHLIYRSDCESLTDLGKAFGFQCLNPAWCFLRTKLRCVDSAVKIHLVISTTAPVTDISLKLRTLR